MGGFSSLNKERKRGTKKLSREVDRGARKVEREAMRETEDFVKVTTLGIVDPKAIGAANDQRRASEKIAKAVQLKQKRATQLENAKLSNEIALRSKVAKRGGRRSLMNGGETGFLS
jgi:hypothetical protein